MPTIAEDLHIEVERLTALLATSEAQAEAAKAQLAALFSLTPEQRQYLIEHCTEIAEQDENDVEHLERSGRPRGNEAFGAAHDRSVAESKMTADAHRKIAAALGGPGVRAPEASADTTEIEEELRRRGGTWIGNVRNWLKWNVRDGSLLPWSSQEEVGLRFCELEEIARTAAVGALVDERQARAREGDQFRRIFMLESELARAKKELKALRRAPATNERKAGA